MSDLEVYRLLETFDTLEAEPIINEDKTRIRFEDIVARILDDDELSMKAMGGIYGDYSENLDQAYAFYQNGDMENAAMELLSGYADQDGGEGDMDAEYNDLTSAFYQLGGMQESNTKVQTMGNKIKVTTDGDTTEYDDAETASAMMGGDDDENGFTTESEEKADFKEYCRTCKGTGTTDDGDTCDNCDNGKINEARKDDDGDYAFDQAHEDPDSAYNKGKEEDKEEDKEEVTEGYTKAELQSTLKDLEAKAAENVSDDRLTQRIKNVKQMIANAESGNEQFNEGFGDYDDYNANGTPDADEGIEWSTYDDNNVDHRSSLQRGTPVVLKANLFGPSHEEYTGDRTGIFVSRAKSGSFGTVVRNADGKEISVHMSDIASADVTNSSIYEEYDMNFNKLLAEEITVTQTSNVDEPNNDTTTVTAVGQEASDTLAAMMQNAGLNTGEYAVPMDAAEIDNGEAEVEPTAEPVAMPMGDMMNMMDAPPEESGPVAIVPGPEPELEAVEDDEDALDAQEVGDRMIDVDSDDGYENNSASDALGFSPEGESEFASDDEFGELNFEDEVETSTEDDRLTKLAAGIAAIPKRGEKRAAAIEEEGAQLKADTADRIAGRVQDRFEQGAERIHTRVAERGTETLEPGEEVVAEEPQDAPQHANSPDELIAKLDAIITGTSGGLNKPKTMHPPAAGGDNPMAVNEEDFEFVNEHEDVDNFLNLYKAFSIRGEKK